MIKVFVVFLSLLFLMLTSLMDDAKARNPSENIENCHRFLPAQSQGSFSPLIHLTACEKPALNTSLQK